MLVPQLVSASEHDQRQPGDRSEKSRDYGEALERVHVRNAEESVAEAVDHVEERVEMRKPLPEGRERMDRIEHARKEGQRHDEKILERSDLVDLFGPDAGHHPERAQNRTSAKRERDDPQRVTKFHVDERQ